MKRDEDTVVGAGTDYPGSRTDQAPPIACNLNAFTDEQEGRYRRLIATLCERVSAIRELKNGFAFTFPSDADLCLIAMEFATLERQCCAFLTFTMELTPQGGPLILTLHGPENAKEVLADLVAEMRSA